MACDRAVRRCPRHWLSAESVEDFREEQRAPCPLNAPAGSQAALESCGPGAPGASRACFLPPPPPPPISTEGLSLPLVALWKFPEGPSSWSGVTQCLLWPRKLGTGCLSASLLPSVEWVESLALPTCWAGGRAQGPGHSLRSPL